MAPPSLDRSWWRAYVIWSQTTLGVPMSAPSVPATDIAEVAGVPVDTRHWIGGERVRSATTFADTSPIDGALLAEVARGGPAEARAAVAAARAAFPAWAATSRAERAAILHRIADGV